MDELTLVILKASVHLWKASPNAVVHRKEGESSTRTLMWGNSLRQATSLKALNDQYLCDEERLPVSTWSL